MSPFVARIACSGYYNAHLAFMNMCFIETTSSCVLLNATTLILRRRNIAHLTTTLLVNIKHIGPRKFKKVL